MTESWARFRHLEATFFMISRSYEKSFPFPFVITATRDGICTVDFQKTVEKNKNNTLAVCTVYRRKKTQGLEATHHHQKTHCSFLFLETFGFLGRFSGQAEFWLAVLCFSFLQGGFLQWNEMEMDWETEGAVWWWERWDGNSGLCYKRDRRWFEIFCFNKTRQDTLA